MIQNDEFISRNTQLIIASLHGGNFTNKPYNNSLFLFTMLVSPLHCKFKLVRDPLSYLPVAVF